MNTSRWATDPPASAPTQAVAEDTKVDAPTKVQETSEPIATDLPYESSYHALDNTVDEFAQTRPPDDLFDDDFTPFEESIPTEPQEAPTIPQPDISSTVAPQSHDAASAQFVPKSNRGGRGVPRGPRRGASNVSRHAVQQAPRAATETEALQQDDKRNAEKKEDDDSTVDAAATKPPERREAAVRGDRSGTGGPKHKKLSEDELSAKLAAMKLKNASLMEKHARSQADEELFNQREAVAAQKRKEERVNRQQMMGEREKNRLRKLKAQGGREWDVEKDESTYEENKRGNRRGAYGGVVLAGSRHENASAAPSSSDVHDELQPQSNGSRGRGSGRGRGRGGSRGEYNGRAQDTRQAPSKAGNTTQQVPSANDFPDLPETKKTDNKEVEPAKTLDFPIKVKQPVDKSMAELVSGGEKTSWADQVEQSA